MDLFELAVAKKLAGGGGGGGGDSDFSTCTVTIITNSRSPLINAPVVFDSGTLGPGSPAAIFPYDVVLDIGETVVTVPLYKGSCLWESSSWGDRSVTVSGNIADMGGMLLITGDGTVTVE